nr:hybrid sensor histidine kinase/response regulator [Bacteroidota bacterium]
MNSNPKILLVDDNPINIRVAAKILRSYNYNISFAQSGRDALQKVKAISFDLILLDIMMPEMDGYEVCEKLKRNPDTQKIPVIFLTAKTEPENVVRAFELGGADYVTKPFNGQELLSRVETHIGLKKSREELETINLQLKEANDTKDKMFSIISHDLLGPFGNIKESLELIAGGDVSMDNDSMQGFLKAVWNSTSSAYSLLENLLFWARNQQGRMVYKPKLISLNEIIGETIGLLSGVAKNKSITLVAGLEEKYQVFVDKNAIKTVLRNLISNAIKFSQPKGEIIISVRKEKEDWVVVSVKDSGIGMNKETMNNLYKKDKNEPRWGTRGEKGVGLGLIISREFIEKHGGSLWIYSEEGKGSTFHFTLKQNEN